MDLIKLRRARYGRKRFKTVLDCLRPIIFLMWSLFNLSACMWSWRGSWKLILRGRFVRRSCSDDSPTVCLNRTSFECNAKKLYSSMRCAILHSCVPMRPDNSHNHNPFKNMKRKLCFRHICKSEIFFSSVCMWGHDHSCTSESRFYRKLEPLPFQRNSLLGFYAYLL